MIMFRDSAPVPNVGGGSSASVVAGAESNALHDRSIGDIIREHNNLTADQVEKILAYQREHGLRFGEAAVALGFVQANDVLWALSQQFHYPYAPEGRRKPLHPELIAATSPFSAQAESFRAIRSQLLMRMFSTDDVRRAIAVVSPDSGDGKTFFAANLAVAFSQLGRRTLLVDADMRSPRMHSIFGIEGTEGLSAMLSGRSGGSLICPIDELPNLFVLPVGTVPPNPLELVERSAFGLLMRELLSKFDFVIVDTPAAVYGSDSAVVAAKCGAALAIARDGKSRLNSLQDLVLTIGHTSAKIAGVVMNKY